MSMNKLMIGVAAIALPLGIVNAQEGSTSAAAPDATVTTPDAASSTSVTSPEASTAATPSATAPAEAAPPSATTTTADTAPVDSSAPVQVSKADVAKGATVLGKDGNVLGKVESVTADAAVITTGKARAQIPFASLGKTDKGLMIAMSKTEFEAAASGKKAS